MLIEITYNVTDVYMSTTETPVYVEISFEQPGSASAVWGSITGTLSNQTDLQNALNLKVPYTGATTNVNLGEYELKAGQVTLDTSPTGTAAVGTIRWNDTTGTSETTLKGGNVIIKNGVDLVARVVNKVSPNTTLTKAAYQAVRVSGAQGQRLAIELAQANNDAGSADTIGLVTETIAPNQEGFIMTVGQLEGINTTGSLQGETWVDGDVLYLSPTTAGAITNVKPTGATGHLVIIGYVEYAHANNGKIYVKVINGFELAELHDTSIVTPTNNQGLFYNSSNSLWENKTISTALGYTPVPTTRNITINGVTYDLSADRTWTISTGISGSGASGQVTYWTGASAVSGSNNLFWDNANGRLGIGTNVPAASLDINIPLAASRGIRLNTNDEIYSIWSNSNLNCLVINASDVGSTTRYDLVLRNTGNISIGTSSDLGVRLGVVGDTLLRGSGNTSATTALTVQNSTPLDIIKILNSGELQLNSSNVVRLYPSANGTSVSISGRGLVLESNISTNNDIGTFRINGSLNGTSGVSWGMQVNNSIAPTSGTMQSNGFVFSSTINQVGATGITRGLYVNPTLTAAADFRAIETTAGNVLFGSNFFWDNANGRLGIGTNAPASKIEIATTTGKGISITANSGALNGAIQQGELNGNTITIDGASSTGPRIAFGQSPTLLNSFFTIGAGSGINFYATTTRNFAIQSTISGTNDNRIQMFANTGNLVLQNGGTFTDGGQRLQVIGDTLLRGSGNTNSTTALTVQNSSSANLLTVRNDGRVDIGAGGWLIIGESQRYLYRYASAGIFTICNNSAVGASIDLYGSTHTTNANHILLNGARVNITSASVLMTSLPTSSAGLPSGALWNDAGTVKIV